MALDLSTAALINSGGGILFAAVGIFALTIARTQRRGLLIGGLAATYGVGKAIENVWVDTDASSWTNVAFSLATILLATFLAIDVARDAPVRQRRAFLAAVGVCVAVTAIASWQFAMEMQHLRRPDEAVSTYLIRLLLSLAHTIAMLLLASACALGFATHPKKQQTGLALLALAFGMWAMWILARVPPLPILPPATRDALAALNLALFATTLFWIPAIRRGRLALTTLLVLLGTAAASMVVTSIVLRTMPAGAINDLGAPGVLRSIGALLLVVAILRHDLLGVELPRLSVRRGPLAAGAFALLFIVAQLAENFFEGRFGLLLGSVVAGAFLFAAHPLQRLMERAARAAPPEAGPASAHDNERLYQLTLRKYLADGALSRDDEIALAHLADELRIGARRATELRHAVEAEAPG